MRKKECVAMLLAGGQGSRLGALTRRNAKPAVAFGGKYRIIDFGLSNCVNSNIDTVGVLTQYKPMGLNAYLSNGAAWDLDLSDSGIYILQPYATESGGNWYHGTADAIYRNIDFIDQFSPEYVLVLSGDHLYTMDYADMLKFHKDNDAALSISVIQVPWEEANRFGIVITDENGMVTGFEEKPENPVSNLASMGVYIFTWDVLRAALLEDHANPDSEKDFGKNVIPQMLAQGHRLFAYTFNGYWKDVGTIESYFESQMSLLEDEPEFDIFSHEISIYSNSNISPPHYIGRNAVVEKSLVCNGCTVLGEVRKSIISSDAYVGDGAIVENSILLPGAVVEEDARVIRAIVGEGAVICKGACFTGGTETNRIAVIGDGIRFESI